MKRALTAQGVRHAKPESKVRKLADGGGLYLRIAPSGAKHWRYKFRLGGKETTYGLGEYPALTLEQARHDHALAHALVRKGISPVQQRKALKHGQAADAVNSFEAVARAWMKGQSSHWSPTYAHQVKVTLERDVFPRIGKTKIRDLQASDLRPILTAVAARRLRPNAGRAKGQGAATVAILIRQWCSQVLCYAIAHGLADIDVAAPLKQLVVRPKVLHHSHLSATELPAFVRKLRDFTGTRQVGIAVELLMLTFVRTGELRGAEWSELDMASRLWRIPAARMKMGREHLVPLSDASLQLIAELREITGHSRYLFPNQRQPKTIMSMTTVNRALERIGYGGRLSGHGFRGTASTLLNERGYPAHVIEKQLAHDRKNKIEAAYNHAEFLLERTKMMQEWADIVRIENDNVISINKAKKST